MNGYVNIEQKFADAIVKFALGDTHEITVVGIHKYLDSLLSINKLLVANGSVIDSTSEKVEYNLVFNVSKNSSNDILITIFIGNIIFGIAVAVNDKISKIGG